MCWLVEPQKLLHPLYKQAFKLSPLALYTKLFAILCRCDVVKIWRIIIYIFSRY